MRNLYETDFQAWMQAQADLLRNHQWSRLDLPNLIEEIESLGKQQRQELRNRLSLLIGNLLKWQYQPEQRHRSCFSTIRVQRIDLYDLLEENPSLKSYLREQIQKAYRKGIELAVGEANLPYKTFPQDCPYTFEQILDNRFYPSDPSAEAEEDF
jgi:hypothetical protein